MAIAETWGWNTEREVETSGEEYIASGSSSTGDFLEESDTGRHYGTIGAFEAGDIEAGSSQAGGLALVIPQWGIVNAFFDESLADSATISDMKWWEDMHPRHQIRMGFALLIFFLGMLDLAIGIGGGPSVLHWSLDLLAIWGAVSVFLTAVLLAMRYR